MTAEEFNDKWKDYLEEGHYGLIIGGEVPAFLDSEVFPYLTQIEGFSYSQIKIKFNDVRFYSTMPFCLTDGVERRIQSLIQ